MLIKTKESCFKKPNFTLPNFLRIELKTYSLNVIVQNIEIPQYFHKSQGDLTYLFVNVFIKKHHSTFTILA